jgi:hypothetical protein
MGLHFINTTFPKQQFTSLGISTPFINQLETSSHMTKEPAD